MHADVGYCCGCLWVGAGELNVGALVSDSGAGGGQPDIIQMLTNMGQVEFTELLKRFTGAESFDGVEVVEFPGPSICIE